MDGRVKLKTKYYMNAITYTYTMYNYLCNHQTGRPQFSIAKRPFELHRAKNIHNNNNYYYIRDKWFSV